MAKPSSSPESAAVADDAFRNGARSLFAKGVKLGVKGNPRDEPTRNTLLIVSISPSGTVVFGSNSSCAETAERLRQTAEALVSADHSGLTVIDNEEQCKQIYSFEAAPHALKTLQEAVQSMHESDDAGSR